MIEDSKRPTELRKITFDTKTYQENSIPLYQCRKTTGALMPTNGAIEAFKVEIPKNNNSSVSCAYKTIDEKGDWAIIKNVYHDNKVKEVFEEYSNRPTYYKRYVDDKLMEHKITDKNYVWLYKYEYDKNGNRTKDLLYSEDGRLIEVKEY